jgi:nucleoside-diphosphate-sugar epimerase
MRILFTGASSFTGYWFVNTLLSHGHDLVCPLRGKGEGYTGVRQRRVELLRPRCRFVPEAPFGSEAFLELARKGPWDVLCHHGAEVANFRSPQFDPFRALSSNACNLAIVLDILRKCGLKAVVLTGSVFENNEGLGSEPRQAVLPYGLSKGLTFEVFRYYCGQAGVPLVKFVIPNPYGPYEEERFTAYLMRTWCQHKTPTVKTPDYVRDNIPVDLLALVYAQFAELSGRASEQFRKVSPSGYVESQGAFALRVAREVRKRLGWPCELSFLQQQDFSEPLLRINQDPAALWAPRWDERAAWDAFTEFYANPD